MGRRKDTDTLDLFKSSSEEDKFEPEWPKQSRFPLNEQGQSVHSMVVKTDLKKAKNILIVTGYAALDEIVDFCGDGRTGTDIRIVLGSEPYPSTRKRERLSRNPLSSEMERYWLEKGWSLLQSYQLLQTIERIENGEVAFRKEARQHSKIFVTESAVTTGSSNFTRSGTRFNAETNTRFEVKGEKTRYLEARQIAEFYWERSQPCTDEILDLLQKLLRQVPWQEALARACAELLEGEWADSFMNQSSDAFGSDLWPIQRQGIAQALYILDTQDSVLIADATGTGKTKMGVHLMRLIQIKNQLSGKSTSGRSIVVSPPQVIKNWESEAISARFGLSTISQGVLSHPKSDNYELAVRDLKSAHLLGVDEGHNFLNNASSRTQKLLRNMADHVLVFTATPINRQIGDMLRIIDVLGPDNLSPDSEKLFKLVQRQARKNEGVTESQSRELRHAIQKITVRRIKKEINRQIARQPELYKSRLGKPCGFPHHVANIYSMNESEHDLGIAHRISEETDRLYGVSNLSKGIKVGDSEFILNMGSEKYLAWRIKVARILAQYRVRAALRSSKIALSEHLEGTQKACSMFGIGTVEKGKLPNMTRKLWGLLDHLPPIDLDVALPDWLSDVKAWNLAVNNDIKVYKNIRTLASTLTEGRENRKLDVLEGMLGRHDLVLAFDSKPITLAYFYHLLSLRGVQSTAVWGGNKTAKKKLIKAFELGSDVKHHIGLCSDVLSEGVNLQQASALVHLDMCSVVRTIEQRSGRIDRVDSPHQEIEVLWPKDGPEFALKAEEKLVHRYDVVETTIGGNVPFPEEIRSEKIISPEEVIKEYQDREESEWSDSEDAFESVRSLIYGPDNLIPEEIYREYCSVKSQVLSRVSLIRSKHPWVFFCLSDGEFHTPRWVFIDGKKGLCSSDLDRVVSVIRANLNNDVESLPVTKDVGLQIQKYLKILNQHERFLISQRKQRALGELEFYLGILISWCSKNQLQNELDDLLVIESHLKGDSSESSIDWGTVATSMLDIIHGIRHEEIESRRKKSAIVLKDFRVILKQRPKWLLDKILSEFQDMPVVESAERRVSSCIIGMT